MDETLTKLFAERRAQHQARDRAATTSNSVPEAQSQQETSAKNYPEGSASDPICLTDDDDSQSKVGATTGHEADNKTGTSMKQKRPRSVDSSDSQEPDRKISAKEMGDTKSLGQDGQGHRNIQVPMKLLTTRLDEQNRRATDGKDSTSFRSTHATLRELLGFDNPTEYRQMNWLVAANYLVDFDFLMNLVPELLSCPISVFFYGSAHSSPEPWRRACTLPNGTCTANFVQLKPSDAPNSPTNPLRYTYRFGVHHTKMFLIGYESGIRVIIYTANICPGDTHYKAQGAYVQDFPLKGNKADSSCQFENDLVSYMETYGYKTNHQWDGGNATQLTEELRRYDFSSAQVVLIPSTPGYHKIHQAEVGLLKLRETIRQHAKSLGSSTPVVCQFSSMGSLNAKWLSTQFLPATSLVDPTTAASTPLSDQLKLVYPTVEEIRTSVEGYIGGGSVPGGMKNVNKPLLQSLLCRWSSGRNDNPFQMGTNVPHIKTFYQLGEDRASMNWLLLSSHNLSITAWGQEQTSKKYGSKSFFIQHWELGVFFSPQLLGAGPNCRFVPYSTTDNTSESSIPVALPYSVNPEPYGTDDKPWAWDAQYEEPDRFGRFGVSGPGQAEGAECAIQ